MVASIGKIAAPAQGLGYFEKDRYYAKDDAARRGTAALGLEGPVEPEAFRRVLEGEVPGDRRLGSHEQEMDGTIRHRPGRAVTLAAPKSVSIMAIAGGDERVVESHVKAVGEPPAPPGPWSCRSPDSRSIPCSWCPSPSIPWPRSIASQARVT